MRTILTLFAFALASTASAAAASAADKVCAPGQSVACVGAGGCQGGQVCKADGSGYDTCACTSGSSGSEPASTGTSSPSSSSSGSSSSGASSASATGEGPAESGFSFGVRVGYGIPFGTSAKDRTVVGSGSSDLNKGFSGIFPIWFDAGYRATRNIYVGAFFQYAFANTSGDLCQNNGQAITGCSSSGSDVRLGVNLHYHINPETKFHPWVGVGFGYEWASLSISAQGQNYDLSVKGFEFVNLQVGGDYRVMPALTIGPFATMTFAQFGSYSHGGGLGNDSGDISEKGMHEWLILGARGQFDL